MAKAPAIGLDLGTTSPTSSAINPDEAVVYGAAVQNHIFYGENSEALQNLSLVATSPESYTEMLKSYVFSMRQFIKDEKLKDQIAEEDKTTILDKCNVVMKWLDSNQAAEKDEFEHQQNELEKVWAPVLNKLYLSGSIDNEMD